MSAKQRRLRSPDKTISFRKAVRKSFEQEIRVLELGIKDLKGGFAEEFPLLCAEAGAAVIPQVMVLDPDTGKPVPLLSECVTIEEHEDKKSAKSAGGKSTGSATTSASASSPLTDSDFCPPPTPYVTAMFDDNVKPETLRKLIFQGFPVDNGIVMALGTIISHYPALESIHMKNSGLTADLLKKLVTYLSRTKSVREIILDDNPIEEQNFYLFVQEDTRLERLTLRRCKIDDDAVTRLAENLTFKDPPQEQTLAYLNLSENKIGDKGLESLAKGLRTNRTLLELVLARNVVGDPGATALAAIAMKFPLNAEELKFRKQRADRRSKARFQMVEEMLHELVSKSGVPFSQSRKSGRPVTVPISNEIRQRIEAEVDKKLSVDTHPYSWDARPDGLDMWCIGNFQLKEICLDYNKVGMVGIHKFLDTLEYQMKLKEAEGRDRSSGLTCIRLQGNAVSGRVPCLDKIQEILTRHIRAMYPTRGRRRQPSPATRLPCKHTQTQLYRDGSACTKCSIIKETSFDDLPKDANSVAIGSTPIPRSPFLESSARKSERKRLDKATRKRDSTYDVIRRFS